MKNITLKMDEGVITRVRHVAVDEHKSVSAWVRDLIVGELDLQYAWLVGYGAAAFGRLADNGVGAVRNGR